MTAKPGGDQILLRKYSGETWGDAVAITPPGGDLWRPTLAIDGKGRPWVFWSANEKGNFDIWARVVENGTAWRDSAVIQRRRVRHRSRSRDRLPGRVWVAWQGWRERQGVHLRRDAGREFVLQNRYRLDFDGNEWNPAIAADGRRVSPSPGTRIVTATTTCTRERARAELGQGDGCRRLPSMKHILRSRTILRARSGWPTKRARSGGAKITAPTRSTACRICRARQYACVDSLRTGAIEPKAE